MSIATEIQTLQANKAAIKAAIEAKNPSVAPTDVLSQWPTSIASISGGSSLPYDAEVEYLESIGTQYVDTGVAGNPTFTRLDISVTTLSSIASAAFLCGARGVDSAHNVTGLILVYLSGANSLWRLDTTGSFYAGDVGALSIACNASTDYEFSMQGTICSVNGVTYSSTATKETADSGLNIYIGTSNNNGAAAAGIPIRIRSAALWQNGVLVRDFIPVRVGSVGCLFDRANPTVGMNADGTPRNDGLYFNRGTGDFLLGPDKPTEAQLDAIKTAIEAKEAVIPPVTKDYDQWPAAINSIPYYEYNEYRRPSDWPDIPSILAAHPASEKGYGYNYIMLVQGNPPPSQYHYIRIPGRQAGCRHYLTSWGVDADAPTSATNITLYNRQDAPDYEWIIVYADNANNLVTWGPSYSTYFWEWLLWLYAPGGNFTTVSGFDRGFNGIISLREITAASLTGRSMNLDFGYRNGRQTCRVDIATFYISSADRINGELLPYTMSSYPPPPKIVVNSGVALKDWHQAFQSCCNIRTLDTSGWRIDTNAATQAQYMFNGCSSLTAIDVTGWNMSSCTRMDYMFASCVHLKTITGIGAWRPSACTRTDYMFSSCVSINSLDLSGWRLGSATNVSYMFSNCQYLKSIDCSNWGLSAATNVSYMFNGCGVLEMIGTSGWVLTACTNTSNIFAYCMSLREVDTSTWAFGALTTCSNMFTHCMNLTTIDMSGWNWNTLTSCNTPFDYCGSLRNLIGSKTVAADGSIGGSTAYWEKGPKLNLPFTHSTALSHDSLLFLMYWLPTVTTARTLTIGSVNKAKLSAAEIAVATAKNWTVS